MVNPMEKEKMSFEKKMAIVLCTIVIFVVAYFLVIGPYLNRFEGDPRLTFYEVPVSETINSTIIHLTDSDIMDIRGLDVKLENGKIHGIYLRSSDRAPGFDYQEFFQKYDSRTLDSKRYLEYKGVYYYAMYSIP
jgi:hypothetical protein